MTNRRSIAVPLAAVGLMAVAAAAFWWRSGNEKAPPNESAAPAAAATPAQQAPPAGQPGQIHAVDLPTPSPQQLGSDAAKAPPKEQPYGGQVQYGRSATPGTLTYPDGSTQKALNGVGSNVLMLWEDGRPYSPIVGTMVDRGWEWYRHADGTLSTVQIVEVNGVPQVTPMTVHPNKPVPVAPGNEPAATGAAQPQSQPPQKR